METVERLWAIEQIKQLKSRYFRTMDKHLWDELGEVFAEDAVAGTGKRQIRGRQGIVDFIRHNAEGARTAHHGHMPEIVVLDEAHAKGIWAMFDYFEERSGDPPKGFTGFGHYDDEFIIEDGRWRIVTMRLSRIRIVALPGGLPDFYARE